jgi:hypothetical protein
MICVASAIVVQLSAKLVVIKCENGSILKSQVIIGKPSSPTLLGSFTTYYLGSEQTGYKKNVACFLEHSDGSHYCFHANDQSLPQKGSLGCIRLPSKIWRKVLIPVGTNVLITK